MLNKRIDYGTVAPGAIKGMLATNGYHDRSTVAQNLRRIVELRASQINGCGYCIWLHARQLRQLGETEDRIESTADWRSAKCFDEPERAALNWAECVTRIADGVPSDDAYARLQQHFSEIQIVDLTSIIANMNALNRMAISFLHEAPEHDVSG